MARCNAAKAPRRALTLPARGAVSNRALSLLWERDTSAGPGGVSSETPVPPLWEREFKKGLHARAIFVIKCSRSSLSKKELRG